MKTIYIYAVDGGFISALTEEDYGFEGYEPIEVEDGFDVMTIDDYRLIDGALSYTGEGTAAREEAEAKAAREARRAEQVLAAAKLQVASMPLSTMSDTEVVSVDTLLPDWVPDGHDYKQGEPFQWDMRAWRASQPITSQSIYPPDCSEALYYEIKIAPDGIIVYRPCTGQHDAVRAGELRHYPDADGPVYRSKVDYNAYSPDVRPDDWELVSGEPETEPDPEPDVSEYDPDHWYESGEKCLWNGKVYVWDADGRLGVPGVWSPDGYPEGWTLVSG